MAAFILPAPTAAIVADRSAQAWGWTQPTQPCANLTRFAGSTQSIWQQHQTIRGRSSGLSREHANVRAAWPAAKAEPSLPKETYKIFDEVDITVKSGGGGAGEVTRHGKQRIVPNFKYKPGGNAPKKITLPPGDPAPGTDGAHVILFVDPALDSLLHLHATRKAHVGKDGTAGNPAEGSNGPLARQRARRRMASLRIGVPPGTVVKKRKGGQLLGELISPGDELVVARGGQGGAGAVAPPEGGGFQHGRSNRQQVDDAEVETIFVEDVDWKADARGAPGEEVKLHLLMRVVADVGIVGLPNAGKSSLLAALTRATPEVASYPFTTLMPNLGVLQTGGDPELGLGGDLAVLADMPGLIQGAHEGRGLGRMFLRHLRRTRLVLHVVDAAAQNPGGDYWAVREELRMYNPEYCQRPHVVVLNKMDLEDASELQEEVAAEVMSMAEGLRAEHGGDLSVPSAIVCISAKEGTGVELVREALEPLLASLTGDTDLNRRVSW